ncbi:MAG: OmpA family protein [Desulfobacteraceae bacterium]
MHHKISRLWLLIIAASLLFVGNPQITAGETKLVNPVKPAVNQALKKRTAHYFRELENSNDASNSEDLNAQLRVVLRPIYFSLNSSALSAEAIQITDTISSFLKAHPSVKVLAEGYAFEPGDSQYNLVMGEDRAISVKNRLTGSGVATDRVMTISYGIERSDTNCGSDEICKAKYRRVDWQVLSN